MAEFFSCFSCKKIMLLSGGVEKTCPSCGGVNGEALSHKRVNEGMAAGAYFNIDPATGKPAKKKRR